MIINNIKIAWRNLVANKTYSILNISGLVVGMAVAMMIALWIWDEISFDRTLPEVDRVATIMQSTEANGKIETNPWTPYPLAEVLRNEYADRFDQVVLATDIWDHTLDLDGKRFENKGAFMEEGAARLFGLKMLDGSLDALSDPAAIIISDKMARKIFGNDAPVGKILKMDREHSMKVAGVYENMPANSTMKDLEFIAPWKHFFAITDWIRNSQEPWRPNAFYTYVKLKPNADLEKTSLAIQDVRLKHVNERIAKLKPRLHLHGMSRWHLYDEFRNGVNTGGRIQYVWLFLTIGIFVLTLACINFMNLSTARSEKRAKEVGIRKTIGSLRSQLIVQFFLRIFHVCLHSFPVLCITGAANLAFF